MSARLPRGGRLIDRGRPLSFTFDGKRMRGYAGDTLASALLANDQVLQGRSFKYHRPRGPLAAGPEEPNALLTVGTGGRTTPNVRATTSALTDGAVLRAQNAWPALEADIGAVTNAVSRLFPAGFYYKTFIHPRPFWKHLFEPVIRRAAGLGPAPSEPDPATYEHYHAHTDVLVIGGGIAGLEAARTAAATGAEVLLLEQAGHVGGRAVTDGAEVAGEPAGEWVNETLQALELLPNVRIRAGVCVQGVYDHGYVLASETLPGDPAERLWRIRARQIVVATGGIERPLAFAGNDVPGVMLASAIRDYLIDYGVSCGDRTVIVTNNDDAYRTALALLDAGLRVPAIVDVRPDGGGPLAHRVKAMGVRVFDGHGIAEVKGRQRVRGVALCRQVGEGTVVREIACDAVAMSGGWSPAVHLWSHAGGKLTWDATRAMFVPDPNRPPTGADGQAMAHPAGLAAGHLAAAAIMVDAHTAGFAAARGVGATGEAGDPTPATDPQEAPIGPAWTLPESPPAAKRAKMFLDFQNDVKVSDVGLAAQEGYESVEHAKRYTTLGMATDQGKTSNINGLAILAQALDKPVAEVGTTTFRPPYTPVTLGAVAGEAKGDLFQPLRRTPMHDWHAARGAKWEPVGQWRRPYAYPRPGEPLRDAVNREILSVRQRVGMIDASTLGKILVQGPDAGRFLDLVYTGRMSTLAPGRCRYGLMCTENGFLFDDGVVARLGPDLFLCHTTSGGADGVHAHLEDWLQCEWWDMDVRILNVTEAHAQIAVAGPLAAQVLARLEPSVDIAALAFMSWTDATLAGFPVRLFGISFSGEPGVEIAVAAGHGLALWEAIYAAGQPEGLAPYGTEALHVLRAEKGFIMIGDETDGTVIPQDLGLDWAIARAKDDNIGKRAQARSHLTDPDRWRLVGLETLDGSVLPEGAYAATLERNALGQRVTEGRVTSTYYSPTLGRGIALALVARGPERMGDVLQIPRLDGRVVAARIVSPVFYDPKREPANA